MFYLGCAYDDRPSSGNTSIKPGCAGGAINGHGGPVHHQFLPFAERYHSSSAAFNLSHAPRIVPPELRGTGLDHFHFSVHGLVISASGRLGHGQTANAAFSCRRHESDPRGCARAGFRQQLSAHPYFGGDRWFGVGCVSSGSIARRAHGRRHPARFCPIPVPARRKYRQFPGAAAGGTDRSFTRTQLRRMVFVAGLARRGCALAHRYLAEKQCAPHRAQKAFRSAQGGGFAAQKGDRRAGWCWSRSFFPNTFISPA
jgi:hypothetical protein